MSPGGAARIELAVGKAAADLGDVCLLAARLLAPASTSSVADGARFVRGAAEHLRVVGATQKMAFWRVYRIAWPARHQAALMRRALKRSR